MDPQIYQFLKWLAMGTAVLTIGITTYSYITGGLEDQTSLHYRTGNLRLEDGHYQEALEEFEGAIKEVPSHSEAYLGKALSLKGIGQMKLALETINIALELRPDFGAAYANRGIIHDFLGKYQEALQDYRRAIEIDPGLAEGAGFLTRFLRNQPDTPPTIADRANYLEQELQKLPDKRLLRVPEEDEKQQGYKYEGVLDEKK
ncbi:MAG: tetratricopeptide repeat protein [SAR324 cluster bacterium]|nr:tetratricopeptide repeat protein [SAR324 cluster bacterium]